ncbi:MAG: flagellar hook-basal body complex protein FliE [Candidatus Adiutricales bacterium]
MEIDNNLAPEPLTQQKKKSLLVSIPGFNDTLISSIKEANTLQIKAQEAMENLATGRSQNIHETLLAIEQAEIAFKMVTQVRNKIMSAYQEIMRMVV